MRVPQGMARLPILLVILLAVALATAACGDDADDSEAAQSQGVAEQQGDEHADEDEVAATTGAADGALSIQHHWQALAAIEAGDTDDAIHHVEHILDLVTGEHAAVMQEVLTQLRGGALEDAEHEIEHMLAGTAEPNLTAETLHLQMALDAITSDDPDDATHHLEHFVATAPEALVHDGEGVIAALEAGEADEAGEQIAALIRSITAGAPVVAHDEDEHAHADEAQGEDELTADRTITVVMSEFAFTPAEIPVAVGETVRLVVVNEGSVLHDITADTFHGAASAVGSAEHDDSVAHGHDEQGAFHVAAESGHEAALVFTATEAGTFDLYCSVPGHLELGMTATLVVTA